VWEVWEADKGRFFTFGLRLDKVDKVDKMTREKIGLAFLCEKPHV